MKIRTSILTICIYFICNTSFSQIRGYTVTGEPVILNSNGTWKYLNLDTLTQMQKEMGGIMDKFLSDFEAETNLWGKWKAVTFRSTDKKSSKIIQIDLQNPKSIKYFEDTVFYDGSYRELKKDTSKKAQDVKLQTEKFFGGLSNTHLEIRHDSSYVLDNQPILFGIVADSKMLRVVKNKWRYDAKNKKLLLTVGKDDVRDYLIISQTKDKLVIDDFLRELNDFPEHEITFIRE